MAGAIRNSKRFRELAGRPSRTEYPKLNWRAARFCRRGFVVLRLPADACQSGHLVSGGVHTGAGAPLRKLHEARLDQFQAAEEAEDFRYGSGSRGTLPCPGPLGTGLARFPGTRLERATGALRVMLCSCVPLP